VRLRIEEQLGVHDALLLRPKQVRPGKVMEVIRGLEHTHRRVVDRQKARQIGEVVGCLHRRDVAVGQGQPVALREREHHVGLESSLQVQVQFGLG